MMAKQGRRIGTKAGDKGGGTPCLVARVRGGGCIQIQHHSWWWSTVLAAAGNDRARHRQGGVKVEVEVGGWGWRLVSVAAAGGGREGRRTCE
jgi:hypothetical protein